MSFTTCLISGCSCVAYKEDLKLGGLCMCFVFEESWGSGNAAQGDLIESLNLKLK